MSDKYKCTECGWKGYRSEIIKKDSPLKKDDVLWFCPECNSAECFEWCCEQENCWNKVDAGVALTNGDYIQVCWKHIPEKGVKREF